MKHANSLEEEREALLEQIHSSRAAYRRMLGHQDYPQLPDGAVHRHVRNMPAAFPRSMTMRWILDHPYAVAGTAAGLVALAVIGPRRVMNVVQSAPGVRKIQDRLQQRRMAAASGAQAIERERQLASAYPAPRPSGAGAALAGLTGVVTMLMRDPAKMRMLARAASTATDWLRQRRQQHQKNQPGQAAAPYRSTVSSTASRTQQLQVRQPERRQQRPQEGVQEPGQRALQ